MPHEDDDALRTHIEVELGVLKAVVQKLERALFGNGQPGAIDKLQDRVGSLEKRYWIALGALGLFQFLSGGGVLSLKGLLGK